MLPWVFENTNNVVDGLDLNPKFAQGVIQLVKDGILTKGYVQGYLKSRLEMGKIDNLSYIEIMDAIK